MLKRAQVSGLLILLAGSMAAGIVRAQEFKKVPSPALLVVNKEGNLAIVDPRTGTVVARIPTGEGPHEVAASTDGKLAFVTNYGAKAPGSNISLMDLASQKELRRIEIGAASMPHGVTFAGGKLYFTAQGFKLIGSYDVGWNKIDWLMGTGQNRTHMVILTKDMSRIFTSNIGSDSITVFDKSGDPPDWQATQIPVGKGPEAIDLSPDQKEIWTAHSGDGGISIIDTAAKKVIQTIDIQTTRANRLQFTPDGKQVLVSDIRTGTIVVLDAPARKVVKRIQVGTTVAGILIQPDGALAYAAVTADNNLAVIDLKTLEIVRRIFTGVGPDGMAWVGSQRQ